MNDADQGKVLAIEGPTTAVTADAAPPHFPSITRGSSEFARTNLAMFAAGFSTFALMYCVQPLLPVFSHEFNVTPTQSSLSLSLTTAFLAVAMLVVSSLSEAWGRKPVMVASLLTSAVLTVVSGLMPGWREFLLVRSIEGIALSGLPAVAMAYLTEEMDVRSIGLAMGLYIGGSALGGMSGRLLAGVLTDFVSWRLAMGVIGGFGILAGLIFWRSLPASKRFQARPLALGGLLASIRDHLRDQGLPWLFAEGFLLMGSFVTVYNYIGYRLMAAPYHLSQASVGAIFAVYLVGIVSSAWVGDLASRLGRRNVLWTMIVVMLAGVGLSLLGSLVAIIAAIAVLTFGFFGAHSVLSSWVGLRARHARAQASSLYLFFYYLGSSVVGSCGGLFWSASGWLGVAASIGVLLLAALAVSFRLVVLQPIGPVVPAAAP
jgi:MFS transporter, YNFM family, putative membrane transport protein